MKDIKIRYTVQHDETGYITSKVFTLKEIELSKSVEWLKDDVRRYGVIGRDMFTGLLDVNGKEIYQNDIVKFTSEYTAGGKYVNQFNKNVDGFIEWSKNVFNVYCWMVNVAEETPYSTFEPVKFNSRNKVVKNYKQKHHTELKETGFEVIGNIYEPLTQPLEVPVSS